MTAPEKERRVQEAVRRHARTRAFAEAEDVISAVLSDPGVQEARARVEAAETQLGRELCARLQPFQDRHDHALAEGDTTRLTEVCGGKHGRWGRLRRSLKSHGDGNANGSIGAGGTPGTGTKASVETLVQGPGSEA